MSSHQLAGLTALLIIFAGPLGAAAQPLHLDGNEITAAGIQTTSLSQSQNAQDITAQGTVLDPAAMMRTQSALMTATANVAAAHAQMVFTAGQVVQNRKLYAQGHNISQASLQQSIATAAQAQAALTAAAANLAAEQASANTRWGQVMTQAMQKNAPIISQIAGGSIAIIGVSLPPGPALARLPANAAVNDGNKTYTLSLIGGLPGMLSGMPGEAVLYTMPTQPNLPIGTYLNVGLATGAKTMGVIIPTSGVIWKDGQAIAYRATSDGNFEPVDISTASPVAGGYFIPAGHAGGPVPGDHIVTKGAELLAAAPTSPPAASPKAAKADPDDD